VAGNMLYLYIFGDNIEAAYSKIKYAVFYFVCGALAAMVHYLFNSLSNVPAIGASGAISGILGSYLVLYPNSKITSLVYIGWGYYFTSISAKWFILFWFVYQVFLVFIGEQSGVAYWAHIGGIFTGLIVTVVLKDKLLRRRYMFPYF
ncbi:MAG TPA: rhomboid family intramembrane serine protease, partial [Thermoplasmata archaeon]|nr:rhomboid family intramembrane serine protease [Thermoplasmata archaeon]